MDTLKTKSRNWAEEAERRIFGVSEQFIIDYLDIVDLNGFDVNEYILNLLVSRHGNSTRANGLI